MAAAERAHHQLAISKKSHTRNVDDVSDRKVSEDALTCSLHRCAMAR